MSDPLQVAALSGRLKGQEPLKKDSLLAERRKKDEKPTIVTFERHEVPEPPPTLLTAARSGRLDDVKAFLEKDGVHVDMADGSGSTALMLATISGRIEVVKSLLEQNANAETRDPIQWTPLMVASAKGLVNIACLLLDQNANVNAMDGNQWTPLMIAASHGHLNIAFLLLDRNANIEATHTTGWTALMFAAQNGHVDVVKLLLGRKANAEATDGNQCSALMVAGKNGRWDVTRLLLEHNAHIDAVDKNESTVLMLAAQNGHLEVTRLLLSKWSANINAKDKNQLTALMLAARNGHVGVARLLLEANARIEAIDSNMWTSLMFSVQNGHLELIKLLLDRDANINAADEDQLTALMIAAAKDRVDVTRLLLDRNAGIEARNTSHWTALMIAAAMGHVANVTLLLDRKADINAADLNRRTPLMIAAQNGHANVARLLLNRDASIINATDRKMWTALMFAAQNGYSDVARVLLDWKPNIEAVDTNQWTSLMFAAQNDYVDVAILLLDRNANVDTVNSNPSTALMIASQNGHVEVARLLLNRNANVNFASDHGVTSLSFAAELGHFDIVRLLLAKNADVNSVDADGHTPLIRSAMKGRASIVSILLDNGAKVGVRNRDNKTALDYAIEHDRNDIIDMIQKMSRIQLDLLDFTYRHIISQQKREYANRLLEKTLALCKKTQTNQSLCRLVHDRIKVVWEWLDSSDWVSEASDLLDAYYRFLVAVAKRENILEQLMMQREVLATLKQFHLKIDTLFKRLNSDELHDWNVLWQIHQSDMATIFQFRVTHEKLLTNAEEWENLLEPLEDEMVRCHDQAYLPAMQFVRDVIVQKMNAQYAVDVFLLKVTNLTIDRPNTSVLMLELQVGTDTKSTKLIMRNQTHVWDIDQGFRYFLNRNMENELKVKVWVHNPENLESNERYEATCPLIELISGISIPFPRLSPTNADSVIACPFKVAGLFGNQERQSMIHLKFCYSDQFRQDPLSPTGAQPGCIICGSPVPPGRLYCASCARVFNQHKMTETLPIWFIPRQRMTVGTVKKITELRLKTNVLVGSLEHDSSVDLWSIPVNKEQERDILVHQIDIWFMLNHPHILRLFGACHIGNPMLCVCEHAAYEAIGDYLSKDSRPNHVWRVLYEAALGLHYLHSQRIVHGDIKSENIVVCIDGKTKLCNFGYSYRRHGASLLYSRDKHTGICWMAPERINGDDMMEPLFESDIYEFGMTIIAAVTGKNPWGSASTDNILNSVLEKSRSFAKPSGVNDAVWSLVMRMCEFDFKKRPKIGTVVEQLKNLALSQGQYIVDTRLNLIAIEDGFDFVNRFSHRRIKKHMPTKKLPDYSKEYIQESSKEEIQQQIRMLWFDMDEVRPMCERFFLHLDNVKAKCESMGEHQRRNVEACHTSIANEVSALLTKYLYVRTITRLLCGPRLAEAFHRFHSQLHYLLYPGDLGNAKEWEKEWNEDNRFRQKTTKSIIARPNFLQSELQKPQAQNEALSFIFDQSVDSMTKHNDMEQKLIEDALTLIKQKSNSKLGPAPAWFVSSAEIKFKSSSHFAKGGYGSVHHGTWNGVEVVIKTPNRQDDESHEMFLKEAEIWFMLSHPHVLNLFCACHVGNPFFVCEYASNGTLMDYVSQVQSRSQIWRRLHEAALGLQYIRTKNIVHHDIKSNNILVGADGKAKLADFGLSFIVNKEDLPALEGKESDIGDTGAIQWKAPEVICGKSQGSFASDVYSLGMCLLEVVSGNIPWGGVPEVAVKYKVLKQKALPKRPAHISDIQWGLITQMCAWEPNDRLGIGEVVEVLEAIVFDELDLEWKEIRKQKVDEKKKLKEDNLSVGTPACLPTEWEKNVAELSWKQLIQLQASVKEMLSSTDKDQEEPVLEPDHGIPV